MTADDPRTGGRRVAPVDRRTLLRCIALAGLPLPAFADDRDRPDLTDPVQLLAAYMRLGPEIRRQTSRGIARPDNPMVTRYRSRLGPALVRGDDLWIPTDVEATIEFPKPAAPSILLNHYTTVHGRLSDALNPDLASAPCEFNFQNVLKWEPFMRMGDHPGHMMSRAAGRKLESVDDLPADYLSMAERMHGQYIADPVKTLEKLTMQIREART